MVEEARKSFKIPGTTREMEGAAMDEDVFKLGACERGGEMKWPGLEVK